MFSFKRLKRSKAAKNAGASYFAFFSTAVCGLFTIPMAVAFLGKEQIGLWTIVSQTVSYLLWLDLGVGDAVGRKIADPIAKGDQDEIDRWWSLSLGVLALQGLVLLVVSLGIWPLWNLWFKISPTLRDEAAWLYLGSVVVAAFAMPLRAYPGVLLAQHRFHWVPLTQGIMPWVQLGGFYLLLHANFGIKAYFLSLLASQLVGWGIFLVSVHQGPDRLRLTCAGFTRKRLGSLFSFSGSVALMGLSQTIVNSLPTVLLGRFGGLAQVPVYGFTNRLPTLTMTLARRTTHAFYPALQRFYVSGERERFKAKYMEVNLLTVTIGLMIAAVIIGFSRSIIGWLAGPEYFAGGYTNLWFGILVIAGPFTQSLTSLLQFSGVMGKSAFVAISRMLVGVVIGWAAYKAWGMPGLAAAFTLLPVFAIAPYSIIRGSRNCGFSPWELCGQGVIWMLGACVVAGLAGWWIAADPTLPVYLRLFGRLTLQPTLRETVAGAALAIAGLALSARQLLRIRKA